MTRVVQQIRTEPDGNPAVGIQTQIIRTSDSLSLQTQASDSNGIVTYEANGSAGPISLTITGQPGGDRSLASGEAMVSGVFSPAELPAAFAVIGDGVIRGYLDELVVTVSGLTLTVGTGAAVVSGYPIVCYGPTTSLLERPLASTRVDRVVVLIVPATGLAYAGVLTGTEGAPAAPLTLPDGYVGFSLATVEVPVVAPVGQAVDERVFSGDRLDVVGTDRVSSASTTSAPGEAITDLAVTLTLPRSVTYDIEADLTGQQVSVASAALGWTIQLVYPDLSDPGQVAVDTSGNVYIADTGNDRVVKLTSGGVYVSEAAIDRPTGLTYVSGSGRLYVAYGDPDTFAIVSYTASTLGFVSSTGSFSGTSRHMTNDATSLYVAVNDTIQKRPLASTSTLTATIGSSGSTNGLFNTPWGIAYKPSTSQVVVVDSGNSRIQRFSTAGVYASQVAVTAGMRGIAIDSTDAEWIACYADDSVQTTSGLFFAQNNPSGIAFASGDVAWVTNADDGAAAKWDEVTSPGGYGQIALELDGTVSDYTGIGQRVGAVANSATGTKVGPGSVVVRGFQKSTLNTATFSGLTLSARAVPRG